jgi:large subunit ribosomal protein L18
MKNTNKNRVFRYNRRIRGLTDYKQRLKLLKSGLTRAVIRKSNNNMFVQLVNYGDQGDKVLISVKSNELKKHGYTLHTGNTSAAYLTGLLAGKKAQKAGVTGEVIVDFGLQEVLFGNKLFGAVKGLVDSGLQVKVGENVFPVDERIMGEHLSVKDAKKVIEKTKSAIEGMK